jgi:hypothetical protein
MLLDSNIVGTTDVGVVRRLNCNYKIKKPGFLKKPGFWTEKLPPRLENKQPNRNHDRRTIITKNCN